MAPLGPFGPAPRLAVGVSGGPHSMALALLAQGFARARGGDAVALIADHGLRPASGSEAQWTARTLASQGIEGVILPLGLPPGPAMQERAREARLAALLAECAGCGRPFLLLGHHAMDQAETVLFRALRGSGPAGLAGMAEWRAARQAVILRPLLRMAPARLEALLLSRKLAPLRDPSNDDQRFTRVTLRKALADPSGTGAGVAALGDAAMAFARRREAMRGTVAARLAAAVTLRPEGWARLDPSALGLDGVAEVALAALLRLLGGARHAPACGAVRSLLARGGGTLHGVLWQDNVLCREPSACAAPIAAVRGALWDGRWRLAQSAPDEGQEGGPLFWGAVGAGVIAIPRRRRLGLPARVVAGLPALLRNGTILTIPALDASLQAEFDPQGGPLIG
ncbi:tRNA lysidine(34) synthetase TilS [Pseudoroseomonas globiformis]|uniref:tRNA(Ile)-lysidine synthase n=1 Tax=Teichococcus globiformis TaxID=2307229 RepID=A0ABV7FZ47_9PROT